MSLSYPAPLKRASEMMTSVIMTSIALFFTLSPLLFIGVWFGQYVELTGAGDLVSAFEQGGLDGLLGRN